ncbi:MAG: PQQ-binding-like beta-propeller repeat protein [Steroidobacteraceae bacterium]
MRITWKLKLAIWAIAVIAALFASVYPTPIHWRAKVIIEKALGQLPQIDWSDLPWMLKPNAEVSIGGMGEPPNPYAVIKNPLTSPSDIADGERLFKQHCTSCHGSEARGGHGGPSLHDRTFLQGRSDWALYRTITHGIPGTAMVGWQLGRENVWRLAAYLDQILAQDTSPATSSLSPGSLIKPVTADELVQAANQPAEWLTYSGSYTGQRYSRLDDVNRNNVTQLHVAWVRQLLSKDGRRLEVSPVVRGTTMYVTALPADVYALDALTGRILWKYKREFSSPLALCCEGNRGVAVLGSRIFFGTEDAHLIALDADTGRLLWDVTVAESAKGYAITAAPLAVNDMIVTGIAGGDYATHGFLDAYDAATGKRRWRFDTLAEPGAPGGETWEPDSVRTGGGPTWMTGSFDPNSGLLYWGVGNPNPDFFGASRKGDNLYTDSAVAIDAATGKLRWFFQFTPHDTHDWDAAQIPVLIDDVSGYPGRKLLAWGNRNGFFYLLDRTTGEYLLGAPFIRQNWTDGLDEHGRPRVRATSIPSREGVLVYPHSAGATNWWSPSYDPELQLMYIPTVDHGSLITATGVGEPASGEPRGGSIQETVPNELTVPAVKAVEVGTGRIRWQHVSPSRIPGLEETGGLMSTAGGLVFGGDLDTFFALDAKTGAELWSFYAGGDVVAAPISYEVEGHQYVVMTAGDSIYTFALSSSPKSEGTKQAGR